MVGWIHLKLRDNAGTGWRNCATKIAHKHELGKAREQPVKKEEKNDKFICSKLRSLLKNTINDTPATLSVWQYSALKIHERGYITFASFKRDTSSANATSLKQVRWRWRQVFLLAVSSHQCSLRLRRVTSLVAWAWRGWTRLVERSWHSAVR